MRAALLLALALASAGCAVGPDYQPPETTVPDRWHLELMRGLAEGESNLQAWWTLLGDPQLTNLIDRAGGANLDIRRAVSRVDQARGQRGVARGDWFPSANLGGSYDRSQVSKEVFDGLPQADDPSDLYAFGIDSSWEIDVFGRIRRSVESATAGLEASVEDYRDVMVSVYAEVALDYVELRTFQERMRLALGNVETQRATLQLTIDRNRAGIVGDLDVRQAEQNLANTEASIPSLRIGLAAAVHRLGVLLGEPPSALWAELSNPAPIPGPPDQVLVELPAELLRQRPDVRGAERRLAAQNARVGVATADLYPRFSILGTFAFQALDAAKIFTGDATAFSIGPAVTWNIFDGGRVRSNVRSQEARTDELRAEYQETVLRALEDTENAMVSFVQEGERRDALERSASASRQAVDLVRTLYKTGLSDFQNVLDSERTLFQAEDALASSTGNVTRNLIRVYRALGGGWAP